MRLHEGNAAGFDSSPMILAAIYAYEVLSLIMMTSSPSSSAQRLAPGGIPPAKNGMEKRDRAPFRSQGLHIK